LLGFFGVCIIVSTDYCSLKNYEKNRGKGKSEEKGDAETQDIRDIA
jgi:hypothetical protein